MWRHSVGTFPRARRSSTAESRIWNWWHSIKVILFPPLRKSASRWRVCLSRCETVSLRCANVYAHMHDPVRITFYRLTDKSIFFTSIAAAASKRADLLWWEIHRERSHTGRKACALVGNHFYEPYAAYFVSWGVNRFQSSHDPWPLWVHHKAHSLNPYFWDLTISQSAVSLHLISLPYSFECNPVWI